MKYHLLAALAFSFLLGLSAQVAEVESNETTPRQPKEKEEKRKVPPSPKKPRPADVTQYRDRGPHWKTIETIVPRLDEFGDWMLTTNSYVHIEPGLSFTNSTGELVETKEEFELLPEGAVARNGQHQVMLPANLNGNQPVVVTQPDGQQLSFRPRGLAYYDASSGQSVLFAELVDTQGFLVTSNVCVYPNAFSGIHADVRVTYSKSGLEHDVVLKQAPPDLAELSEKLGLQPVLNPKTTRLEVWSTFLSSPEPTVRPKILNPKEVEAGSPTFTDQELDFGAMRMVAGRAFKDGSPDGTSVPVGKTWHKEKGISYLVEAVELPGIREQLEVLPKVPDGASVRPKSGSRETVMRSLQVRSPSHNSPNFDQASVLPASPALLASLDAPSFVVDFPLQLLPALLPGNYVFEGNKTYYLNGNVSTSVSSTDPTTFEGGCVIKFNTTTSSKLQIKTPVKWQASLYRPIQFTSKHDNSVGIITEGSSGNPGNYGDFTALELDGSNNNFNLSHFRIAFAGTAISINGGANSVTPHHFRHLQLVGCSYGIRPHNATIYVGNALFHNVTTCMTGTGSSFATVEHATVNGGSSYHGGGIAATGVGPYGPLTRSSLFYGVQFLPNTSYFDGGGVHIATSNPFQTVLGGRHYLPPNSPYRNAGVPWVNADLIADLKFLTTYAPVELTTAFTLDRTLLPQAQRDRDVLDVGYHYAPLDYVWSNLALSTGKTLTLKDGVAVGVYADDGKPTGININGSVVSEGRADALNRITQLNTVQEHLQGIHKADSAFTIFGGSPNVNLRFTDLSFLAAPLENKSLHLPTHFNTVTFRDSQLRGVYSQTKGSPTPSCQLILRNCLCERSNFVMEQGSLWQQAPAHLVLTIQNCLFSRNSLYIARATAAYGLWTITDNLFDGTSIGIDYFSTSSPIGAESSGFITSGWNPFGSHPNDKLGLLRDFQSLSPATIHNGLIRDYYYPDTGSTLSLASLNDADPTTSRSPSAMGLYHYTTCINQAKDGLTPPLAIGFHYPAYKSSTDLAYPDTDSDGVPDYIEDQDGNGSPAGNPTGDPTSFELYNSPNLVPIGSLTLFTPLK